MCDLIVTIRKSKASDDLWVYVESGADDPEAGEFSAIELPPPPPLLTFPDVVAYGAMVRVELEKQAAIKHEFTNLFGRLYGGTSTEVSSIKFLVVAGEDRRWEAFCDSQNRFPAESGLCRLSRVARLTAQNPPPRRLDFPLRMVAYLSAAGTSAEEEFKSLCAEVKTARDAGLPLDCVVHLAEQRLLDAYMATPPDGVAVKPLPAASVIEAQLKGDDFHFVHFFCHGVERPAGWRGLSLATTVEHDTGAEEGSILLSNATLSEALKLNKNVWIAVFNSCRGAASMKGLNSLAKSVASLGCPYVVGMAEPIESDVAKKFSSAFYHALFDTVWRALDENKTKRDSFQIDLSGAMTPARKVILDHCKGDAGGAYGRWLAPLLYMRTPEPLSVVLSLNIDTWKRVREVASTLAILPPTTPMEIRRKLLEILDAPPSVPKDLRPDEYGKFS